MPDIARVDELWEPTLPDSGSAPYLETNRWLAQVICTAPERAAPPQEPVQIPFLGHTILWTTDRHRPFPAWVAEALVQLLEFSELPEGWDSYGGRGLQRSAVGPVLTLLTRIHQFGRQARLVPLPDGGVGLRLAIDTRDLEIDVSADGKIDALLEREGFDDIPIGPEASLSEAEQLLDQFVA